MAKKKFLAPVLPLVYTGAERECKRMIRNKKNAYKHNIMKNRNMNPKQYYSYVNSAKRNKSRFGPLKDNGEFVINPVDQAKLMNKFYLSVFTRSNGDSPSKPAINGNEILNDIKVTEERVKEVIDGVRENAAPGPDKIQPIFLKMLQEEVATPLKILFQKSIDDGQIPEMENGKRHSDLQERKLSQARKL